MSQQKEKIDQVIELIHQKKAERSEARNQSLQSPTSSIIESQPQLQKRQGVPENRRESAPSFTKVVDQKMSKHDESRQGFRQDARQEKMVRPSREKEMHRDPLEEESFAQEMMNGRIPDPREADMLNDPFNEVPVPRQQQKITEPLQQQDSAAAGPYAAEGQQQQQQQRPPMMMEGETDLHFQQVEVNKKDKHRDEDKHKVEKHHEAGASSSSSSSSSSTSSSFTSASSMHQAEETSASTSSSTEADHKTEIKGNSSSSGSSSPSPSSSSSSSSSSSDDHHHTTTTSTKTNPTAIASKNIPYYPHKSSMIMEEIDMDDDATFTEAAAERTEATTTEATTIEVFDAHTTSYFEGYGIAGGHAEDEFGGLGLIGVFEVPTSEFKSLGANAASANHQFTFLAVLFLASWFLFFNNRR